MIQNGRIYPGTLVTVTATYVDDDGEPVDPTTVTLKVKSPAGTSFTYVFNTNAEIQRASTGVYWGDVTASIAGRWSYRWEGTGTGYPPPIEQNFIVIASPFYDVCPAPDYS